MGGAFTTGGGAVFAVARFLPEGTLDTKFGKDGIAAIEPIGVNGAGDAVAALFFFHFLASGSAREALSRAASSIFGVLKRTVEAKSREILLIGAQEELVDPSEIFETEAVG